MDIQAIKRENKALDSIFCYFMDTILHTLQHGIPGTFLDTAMAIFLDANPPELSRLLLEAEYSAHISHRTVAPADALALQLVKELSWHIYYDEDPCAFLLSCRNLWGARAHGYAASVFYPILPAEIRQKYHLSDLTPC